MNGLNAPGDGNLQFPLPSSVIARVEGRKEEEEYGCQMMLHRNFQRTLRAFRGTRTVGKCFTYLLRGENVCKRAGIPEGKAPFEPPKTVQLRYVRA